MNNVGKIPWIISVDFDATCTDHKYPDIGVDVPYAVQSLKRLSDAGIRLILFTMRSDAYLDDAVEWFRRNDIQLYGINTNPEQLAWTNSNKVFAHKYIDDAAIGCPLLNIDGFSRPCVDWLTVMSILEADGVI